MHREEIIIIHKSVLIQTGLSSLLYANCRKTAIVFSNYKKLDFLKYLYKCTVFADTRLNLKLNEYRSLMLKNENTITGIAGNNKSERFVFPFNEIISLNDTEPVINKKLSKLFRIPENKNGRMLLTPREKDILKFVAKGLSSQGIADKLFISRHTVITHRKNICSKLGIKTISGLTLYALVNKLI